MTAYGVEAVGGLFQRLPQGRFGGRVAMQFEAQRDFQLLAFLVLDRRLHDCLRDVSYCAYVVGARPQGRHFQQVGKLLAQEAGRIALDLRHDVIRREVRANSDEQAYVVGHDFQTRHFAVQFGKYSLLTY
jgi:hypothetical protein